MDPCPNQPKLEKNISFLKEQLLRGTETAGRRLAESTSTLRCPDRRLRDNHESLADFARVVARSQDQLGINPHIREHLLEIRTAITDTHTNHDMRFGFPHIGHDLGHVLRAGPA